jgi:hypothetical protein
LEADLEAEGKSKYDVLRVRVEIPIDRRMRQSITTHVKGKEENDTSTVLLRYERVPYLCFWCGFIEHDDTDCEKRRIGIPSLDYDARLRCSPVRKFERRQAYGHPQGQPSVRMDLNFSSSDEMQLLEYQQIGGGIVGLSDTQGITYQQGWMLGMVLRTVRRKGRQRWIMNCHLK